MPFGMNEEWKNRKQPTPIRRKMYNVSTTNVRNLLIPIYLMLAGLLADERLCQLDSVGLNEWVVLQSSLARSSTDYRDNGLKLKTTNEFIEFNMYSYSFLSVYSFQGVFVMFVCLVCRSFLINSNGWRLGGPAFQFYVTKWTYEADRQTYRQTHFIEQCSFYEIELN